MTEVPPNFIPDTNPFALPGPPAWWLKKLWDFDSSLVVVPSKRDYLYRLAQRRPKLDPRARLVGELSGDSDSKMLASYGLIPVTTLLSTARWDNPLMWKDLEERCPWRMGGAAKYAAMLDAQEKEKNLRIASEQADRNTYLARDAWKMYQIKTGVRLGLGPTTKPAPAPASRSAAIKILGADGKPASFRL